MTGKELFKEIGSIKEDYIAEAEEYKRSLIHNTVFQRCLVTAAGLLACAGLYWGAQVTINQQSSDMEAPTSSRSDKNNTMLEDSIRQEVKVEQESMDLTDAANTESTAGIYTVSEETTQYYPKEQAEAEGIITAEEEKVQTTIEATGGEQIMSATDSATVGVQAAVPEQKQDSDISSQEHMICDLVAGEKRLKAYPSVLEELRQEDVLIVLQGELDTGVTLWNSFLQSIQEKEMASIDIVEFTMEGAPIITCICFDGQNFNILTDNSRDTYAGSEANISRGSYNYLNLLQTDGQTEVIMSQEAGLSVEQLRSGEEQVYVIFRYQEK